MARSPSPKRRRYDERDADRSRREHHGNSSSSTSTRDHRRDDDYADDHRRGEYDRRRRDDRHYTDDRDARHHPHSSASSSYRDSDRDRDRDRDRERRGGGGRRDDDERDHRRSSSSRTARDSDDRDRRRDYGDSPRSTETDRHESASAAPARRRPTADQVMTGSSTQPSRERPSEARTHATSSRSDSVTNGTPASPMPLGSGGDQDEKLRIKREKLAAWKAKKAAEAATSAASTPRATSPRIESIAEPAKSAMSVKGAATPSLADPAAAAAAAAAAISSRLVGSNNKTVPSATTGTAGFKSAPLSATTKNLPSSLPAKPSFSFNSTATSTTNTTRAGSNLKNNSTKAFGGMMGDDEDDEGGNRETKIGMLKFDDEVDMTVRAAAEDEEDEGDDEDLEGGASYKAKDGARDERMAALRGEEDAPTSTAMEGVVQDVSEVKPDTGADDTPAKSGDKMDVDEPRPNGADTIPASAPNGDEQDEVDELDAYMNQVQAEVKSVDKADRAKLRGKQASQVLDPDADDDADEDVVEQDDVDKVGMSAAEILALAAKKVKKGRELAPIDHSKVDYEPFTKAFYHPPPEVEALSAEEVEELRMEMDNIKIRGADPPKPVAKWSYCGLPSSCIDVIKGLNYDKPTAIQSQAIPAIMSGRDIIGVAKTGSGKTIAFLLPMFRHIKDQRPIRTMEGPIGLIMTPTRELATQIYKECKPFLKALGLRASRTLSCAASCAYGGMPLKDNIADMKRGSEVVVCTPGRMIELLSTNSGRIINLHRVTYLVLDEADRMFDMGFEPQVMKIIGQIRPDRQTVLFSATFPRQMEALARKILKRPLEITVGGRSVVAAEIEQVVEVRAEDTKFNRTLELLGQLFNNDSDARALIFVERQDNADKLLTELLRKNYACMPLHGGMEQVDRDQTINDFKAGIVPVVIATSVAARGLDVKQLKLVIQYDAPNHMEDYVHRAGRTGRAGNKGTSVTFLTPDQERYALDIFKAMQASGVVVPEDVKKMAESFAEKVKAGKASGGSSGFGGKGLERLEHERDAQARAERAAYGEPGQDKKDEGEGLGKGREDGGGSTNAAAAGTTAGGAGFDLEDLQIEIKRGPAPDLSKMKQSNSTSSSNASAAADQTATQVALEAAKAAEATAIAEGKPVGVAKAQSLIANFNAMLKAKTAANRNQEPDMSTDAARRRDPDATDYHAIIWINDYPQKARWKVTNKETMVHFVESTGASITSKGNYYPPGKEPGPGELPKLHLLIESNEEFRVQQAIAEIKRALIEGATMALEAEARQSSGTNPVGRYTV
ncbi:pre-mRNA processing RNA-helicase [Microbotryomycetes sp. JL201]|nr:pre-mRNA processing RNA-helicase [Microbotryomycetes sp. JL201]